jgi:O-antigen/teichoic acid export membrane protein
LVGRPGLSNIFTNIGWLFFDKVMRMGVGLLVTLWVARYLGPQQFGLLNFGLAFVALFGTIGTLGLPSIAVRDIVQAPSRADETLGTTLLLQLMGGTTAFLASVGTIGLLRPEDPTATAIVAILGAGLVFKSAESLKYWFEARVQSKYPVWVENAIFVGASAGKIVLIIGQASVVAFAWLALGQVAAVAIGLVMLYSVKGGELLLLRPAVPRAISLLKDSWPLALAGVSVMIYMRIDQIMLGQLDSDRSVGIYSAAVRISEVWYFIPTVVVASVFPAIVNAKAKGEELYMRRLQQLHDLLVIITLAVAVPMTFLSTWVVVGLFGHEFAAAGPVLAIHIWSAVFVSLSIASGKWFIIENRQILTFQRAIVGAGVNVGLNMVWIPAAGSIGAAYATVVSYAVSALLVDLLQSETRPLFLMKLRAFNIIRSVQAMGT